MKGMHTLPPFKCGSSNKAELLSIEYIRGCWCRGDFDLPSLGTPQVTFPSDIGTPKVQRVVSLSEYGIPQYSPHVCSCKAGYSGFE